MGHPEAAEFLVKIIPENSIFEDFEVEHGFPGIGREKYSSMPAEWREEQMERR